MYVTQLNIGIKVHAESNLIKYVQTYVEDQTLVVEIADTDGSSIILKPLEPIRVCVKLVRIQDMNLSDGVIMTSTQPLAKDKQIDLSFNSGSWG